MSDFAITEYDAFDRAFKTTAVDGTVTEMRYAGNTTESTLTFEQHSQTVTHTQKETRNVFGQSIKVLDNLEGEISYRYDVLGNLETVTNSTDGSQIVTTHDKMGRKTSMTDPSKGSWSYTYNALGELLTQTDNKGQVTTNTYDKLGRKTREVLGSRSTVSSFNLHQLDTVTLSDAGESTLTTYHYDTYGRVSQVDSSLNGNIFSQRTTYDQYGRVFQQFDASGDDRGIRYHYRNGYVHQLQEARDGTKGVYYQRNNEMDAFGNVTRTSQGNGVQTFKVYDPKTGYLSSILASTLTGNVIQDARYQFDGIGNLLERQRHSLQTNASLQVNGNSHNVQHQTFKYDGLNRLTDINNTQQIAYQANGNIDWKFDALNGNKGYYCYDGTSPHALTGMRSSRGGCGAANDYVYDGNGNMTTGRTSTIDYSAFDKPTLIDSSNGESQFAYGAERSRYKRVDVKDGITTTTYYAGNVEVVSTSDSDVITYRRNLPNAIQLQRSNGTADISYLHKDHLGSMDTITNADGEIAQKLYFDAWGKKAILDNSMLLEVLQVTAVPLSLSQVLDITPRGFTGHEHVDHADIIHMNGRIYDPVLGRFMQADPFIQAPKNSQNYNRYAYVLNNPLSLTDPSGFNFLEKLLHPMKNVERAIFRVLGPQLSGLVVSVASYFCGPFYAACVAGGNYNIARAFGTNQSGALRGAFTAGVTAYIGQNISFSNPIAQAAFDGAVGGIVSDLQGGNFGHGFWAAGLNSLVGGTNATSNPYANVVISAAIGGAISKVTGGKFANGAASAAFASALRQNWERGPQLSGSGDATAGKLNNKQLKEFQELLGRSKGEIASFQQALSSKSGNYDKIRKLYGFASDTQFEETRSFLISKSAEAIASIDNYLANPDLLVNIGGNSAGAMGAHFSDGRLGLNFTMGGFPKFATTIHEIGHSVGMTHPTQTYQSIEQIRILSQNALYNSPFRNELHINLQNNAYAFQNAVTGRF